MFHTRSAVLLAIVAIAISVVVPTSLQGEIDHINEARRLLCGGDRDFVFAQDRGTGLIVTTPTISADKILANISSGYSGRAVLQRTRLEPVLILDSYKAQLDSEPIYDTEDTEKVLNLVLMSRKESIDRLPCESAADAVPMREALRSHLGNTSISGCNQLPWEACGDTHVRAFCPSACGCDDPFVGMLLRQGCSSLCDSRLAMREQSMVYFWRKTHGCRDLAICGEDLDCRVGATAVGTTAQNHSTFGG